MRVGDFPGVGNVDFAGGRSVFSKHVVVKEAATIVNVKHKIDCHKAKASVHLNPSLFQDRSTGGCLGVKTNTMTKTTYIHYGR